MNGPPVPPKRNFKNRLGSNAFSGQQQQSPTAAGHQQQQQQQQYMPVGAAHNAVRQIQGHYDIDESSAQSVGAAKSVPFSQSLKRVPSYHSIDDDENDDLDDERTLLDALTQHKSQQQLLRDRHEEDEFASPPQQPFVHEQQHSQREQIDNRVQRNRNSILELQAHNPYENDEIDEEIFDFALLDATPDVLIGPDVEIKGDFQFDGVLRLDGKLQGQLITTKGDVILGPQAVYIGDFTSTIQRLWIDGGKVVGDIQVNEVVLTGKAFIKGDIQCKSLRVFGGGTALQGQVSVDKKSTNTHQQHLPTKTHVSVRKLEMDNEIAFSRAGNPEEGTSLEALAHRLDAPSVPLSADEVLRLATAAKVAAKQRRKDAKLLLKSELEKKAQEQFEESRKAQSVTSKPVESKKLSNSNQASPRGAQLASTISIATPVSKSPPKQSHSSSTTDGASSNKTPRSTTKPDLDVKEQHSPLQKVSSPEEKKPEMVASPRSNGWKIVADGVELSPNNSSKTADKSILESVADQSNETAQPMSAEEPSILPQDSANVVDSSSDIVTETEATSADNNSHDIAEEESTTAAIEALRLKQKDIDDVAAVQSTEQEEEVAAVDTRPIHDHDPLRDFSEQQQLQDQEQEAERVGGELATEIAGESESVNDSTAPDS